MDEILISKQASLFELELPPGNQEVDDTNINPVNLYYSSEELEEFRKYMAKIEKQYGINVSDAVLLILRERFNQ